VLLVNKINTFMHCLYVTLEEEKQFFYGYQLSLFPFFLLVSSKNTDILCFGEHQQLFVVNCISR